MESFEIPVTYQEKELVFPAEFLPMGYTYKIKVFIDEIEVLFEPDEEKNFRATLAEAFRDKGGGMDKALLAAISERLHELLA